MWPEQKLKTVKLLYTVCCNYPTLYETFFGHTVQESRVNTANLWHINQPPYQALKKDYGLNYGLHTSHFCTYILKSEKSILSSAFKSLQSPASQHQGTQISLSCLWSLITESFILSSWWWVDFPSIEQLAVSQSCDVETHTSAIRNIAAQYRSSIK